MTLPGVDEALVLTHAGQVTMTPLRVGQRVRSTSTSPQAGDPGRVARRLGATTSADGDTETTSYLVLWESGGDSWCSRSTIEPLRIGDPLRAPAPGRSRPASRGVQSFFALPYLLLTGRTGAVTPPAARR
jgi:hypothetical protein